MLKNARDVTCIGHLVITECSEKSLTQMASIKVYSNSAVAISSFHL